MTMPTTAVTTPRRRSDWIGGVFTAILVAVLLTGWLLDVQSFASFLLTMAIDLVITILFLIWWFTRRSFTWPQRFLIFACAMLFGLLVGKLTVHTIGQPGFLV